MSTDTETARWHSRLLNNGAIFGATYRGVTALPPSVSHAIGHGGTWLAYHVMRGSTAALIDNLRVLFPERSDDALKRLALMTYRSYAKDTIDFIRSLSITDGELRTVVERIDTTHFDAALAAGHGAIAASAHYGSWELGGLVMRRLCGYDVSLVVMAEPSPAVNRLRRQFRSSFGVDTIEIRQYLDTALKIRRLLGENRVVGMLLDRHLGKDRVAVDFFGCRAYFLRTPALMAYLTRAPLIPSFVYRDDDGSITATCSEPIRVENTGHRDTDVQVATQAFASALEEQIRLRPHCWYQFYPFWASQDLGAKG